LDSNDEQRIDITRPTTLPNLGYDILVEVAGRPQEQFVTICRCSTQDWKIRLEKNRFCVAFCFHDWCYTVFMWKLPGSPVLNIYKLARSTIPKPSKWENICEDAGEVNYQLDQISCLRTLVACDGHPPTGFELSIISKFPTEVRSYIWQYVGSVTPYTAFVLVAGEASRLACHLYSPQTRNIKLEKGSFLSAKTVTVFGTGYIGDLVTGENSGTSCQVLGVVTGVKFVSCIDGICAIKLIGYDWETDWIGQIPRPGDNWYGMIRGPVSVLYLGYNVSFHLTGIELLKLTYEGSQLR
jgi:hypothetical protein